MVNFLYLFASVFYVVILVGGWSFYLETVYQQKMRAYKTHARPAMYYIATAFAAYLTPLGFGIGYYFLGRYLGDVNESVYFLVVVLSMLIVPSGVYRVLMTKSVGDALLLSVLQYVFMVGFTVFYVIVFMLISFFITR